MGDRLDHPEGVAIPRRGLLGRGLAALRGAIRTRREAVSLIIPSTNEGPYLRETVESLIAATADPLEILVVDNGSTDSSADWLARGEGDSRVRLFRSESRLGVAHARNFGAERAGGDVLIFLDAHILVREGWLEPLLDALRDEAVGLAAPVIVDRQTTRGHGYGCRLANPGLDVEWLPHRGRSDRPYPVPLACGCCQSFRADTFHALGGYDPGMIGYGSEDTEIALRAWLLGFEVVVAPRSEVAHLFRPSQPYAVGWSEVVHNKLRIVHAHFHPDRAARALDALRSLPAFDEAARRVAVGDINGRRADLERRRTRTDDWFFDRFPMPV